MKAILVALVMGMLGFGCAHCDPCPSCPTDNAAIVIMPFGLFTVPKGFFDNKNNWLTEDEMRKKMEERRKQMGKEKMF